MLPDADISAFDPLAPSSVSEGQAVTDQADDSYEEITAPPQNEGSCSNTPPTELTFEGALQGSAENINALVDLDLTDFDPLSQEEIEKGIESEKRMNAELLQRSREVVSNKVSAGKSWLGRTISVPTTIKQTLQKGESLETVQPPVTEPVVESHDDGLYDVVDNADVTTAKITENLSRAHNIMSGSRSSTIFKGTKARENFVKLHMAAREKEFTEKFPFTILAGTWNVNGQSGSESLVPWLQSTPDPPDVVAVGFQELDLSAEALVFDTSNREESWIKAIENGLPKKADYTKLHHIRLVGMMLVIYIQSKHMIQVYDVEGETHGTGIMGMMGNKGGVAIRFQLHNTTLCFINSHLAAHLMEYERRNQDFREVFNKLQFQSFQPPMSISQHDMVFWLGDLNYRFDELDADLVKTLVKKQDYAQLYRFDQLHRQRQAGKVFQSFSEGDIYFSPTYKYDPGTDNWDSSEKGRAPAWCDRILYRGKDIQQLTYRSHPALKLSDHKPVSALFSVGVKVVDRSRETRILQEIVFSLDKTENESLPQVKLGKNEFYFENVQFMEERFDLLPIANIGQSPVQFEFINKLEEDNPCKPYIRIKPIAGLIMPGDVFEIELAIFVDKSSAHSVTVNHCKLDDILVLHLVDGKDFFVPINGTYIPSVFGSSLEALARMYGPIRLMPKDTLIQLESVASASDTVNGSDIEPLEIPKELWLMVDHLYNYGMTQENIFMQSGVDADIIKIRHHLDTCQPGKLPGSIFSIGECLLLFLEALPEPVIPYTYHAKCLEASNNYILSKQVVNQLPECHANVFRYLTAFLREILKFTGDNKLDANMIAAVFGGILLRPNPKLSDKKQSSRTLTQKKKSFIYHFLVNDFRD